MLIQAYRK